MNHFTFGDRRRAFLSKIAATMGFAAAARGSAQAQSASTGTKAAGSTFVLPEYTKQQNYRSLKQSTYDTTGGNRDARPIEPGQTLSVFDAQGVGVITHVWFTIAAKSSSHLRELVFRAYWDGNSKPSVEAPIGDFFGLTLNQYFLYESAYLACSPGRSLNCYFAMPYRKGAKITVTNEGKQRVDAFYSNIDYQEVSSLPEDTLYFHAQYRQAAPCPKGASATSQINPDGKDNYVFAETRGAGHLMGVTLGLITNADSWPGEGDDMIFIDDPAKPLIIGTGTEDYICGSWNFGGRDGAKAFGYHYYGAPYIASAENAGGRYCMYRWHGDNPVTFTEYLKHTVEHGHANDRADNMYSVCYWYQREVFTDFPTLPDVSARMVRLHNNA